MTNPIRNYDRRANSPAESEACERMARTMRVSDLRGRLSRLRQRPEHMRDTRLEAELSSQLAELTE